MTPAWIPPHSGRGTGTCTFPVSTVILDFFVQHKDNETGLDAALGLMEAKGYGELDKDERESMERTAQILETTLNNESGQFGALPTKLKKWVVEDSAARIVEENKAKAGPPDRLVMTPATSSTLSNLAIHPLRSPLATKPFQAKVGDSEALRS